MKRLNTQSPVKPSQAKKFKSDHGSADNILLSVPLISIPTDSNPLPNVTVSKDDIPNGKTNCLASLSFVCTGTLQLFEREEVKDLIKQYGGKVMAAVSSKTSFVVLGTDAGPRKIQLIKQHNTKIINEEGLFFLISNLPENGGDSKAAIDALKKTQALEAKIKEEAEQDAKENVDTNNELDLWTKKYAPTKLTEICGNKKAWQQLQDWLHHWSESLSNGFKKGGPEGIYSYRSVLISGPPGIGKTTAAHLIAKLEGFDVIELNASDTRSKLLLDKALSECTGNQSVKSYFSQNNLTDNTTNGNRNIAIIMDEIDGMSAGDRGGVAQLKLIMKETKVPIICICNERFDRKLKILDGVCLELKASRPQAQMLRARIMTICFREKIKIDANAADALVEASMSDMRQIINMLYMIKLNQDHLTQEQSRTEGKNAQKSLTLKSFDIAYKFLGGEMFRNKYKINDAIDLYFHDPDIVPLMIYDTILRTQSFSARQVSPNESKLISLKCAMQSLESICFAEKLDRKMHGSEQQWSLMPYHAIFSCLIPAYHSHGSINGQIRFPSLLGNISKFGKINRQLLEMQSNIRQRISINSEEARLLYSPLLYQNTFGKLAADGPDSVLNVINLLDYYYLSRDEMQYLEDILIDCANINKTLSRKKVQTSTLSGFTRKYNSLEHPMNIAPINFSRLALKSIKSDSPDLDDAIPQDVEVPSDNDNNENDDPIDFGKGKVIQKVDVKKKPALKRKSKAK